MVQVLSAFIDPVVVRCVLTACDSRKKTTQQGVSWISTPSADIQRPDYYSVALVRKTNLRLRRHTTFLCSIAPHWLMDTAYNLAYNCTWFINTCLAHTWRPDYNSVTSVQQDTSLQHGHLYKYTLS